MIGAVAEGGGHGLSAWLRLRRETRRKMKHKADSCVCEEISQSLSVTSPGSAFMPRSQLNSIVDESKLYGGPRYRHQRQYGMTECGISNHPIGYERAVQAVPCSRRARFMKRNAFQWNSGTTPSMMVLYPTQQPELLGMVNAAGTRQ